MTDILITTIDWSNVLVQYILSKTVCWRNLFIDVGFLVGEDGCHDKTVVIYVRCGSYTLGLGPPLILE